MDRGVFFEHRAVIVQEPYGLLKIRILTQLRDRGPTKELCAAFNLDNEDGLCRGHIGPEDEAGSPGPTNGPSKP